MIFMTKRFNFLGNCLIEKDDYTITKTVDDEDIYYYIRDALSIPIEELKECTIAELQIYIKLADNHYKRQQNVMASGVATALFGDN